MSNTEIGAVVFTLSVLVATVHMLGYLFERLWQPRLAGEILAGAVLGPFVLGRLFPSLFATLFGIASSGANKTAVVLNFLYWIGLFLLMFLSGTETRRLMAKENRRETAWLFGLGTTLPFVAVLGLGAASLLPLDAITGWAAQPTPALLLLAVAVAVTSIPVISRIFLDLEIIHTRFASLVLGFAVLEDIVLWGVLAVATGIASSAGTGNEHVLHNVSVHIFATFGYMTLGLAVAPKVLRRLHESKWNVLIKASSVGYLFFILFLYASIAAALDVSLVFAAFLAGFGLVGGVSGAERLRFSTQLESISKVSHGVFIPIYFAIVGYKLLLGRELSLPLLFVFFFASSCIAMLSFGLAAVCAGFRGLEVLNLAVAKNARGGPGIVLASVAYDAGIINAAFYTALVLTAVLTSQVAGMWLRFVLSRGWPLLSTNPDETCDQVAATARALPRRK